MKPISTRPSRQLRLRTMPQLHSTTPPVGEAPGFIAQANRIEALETLVAELKTQLAVTEDALKTTTEELIAVSGHKEAVTRDFERYRQKVVEARKQIEDMKAKHRKETARLEREVEDANRPNQELIDDADYYREAMSRAEQRAEDAEYEVRLIRDAFGDKTVDEIIAYDTANNLAWL